MSALRGARNFWLYALARRRCNLPYARLRENEKRHVEQIGKMPLRFPRYCPPRGLVRRAKAGCVVVVEEKGRDTEQGKKSCRPNFLLELQSSALALHVGSASADEQSTLSPKEGDKGMYFSWRLLSNQLHLGGSLLALPVSRGAHQPSAAAHPSPELKSSSLIRGPERHRQRQLFFNLFQLSSSPIDPGSFIIMEGLFFNVNNGSATSIFSNDDDRPANRQSAATSRALSEAIEMGCSPTQTTAT